MLHQRPRLVALTAYLALLPFVAFCSWVDDKSRDADFSHAYAMPSCGPADGPAFDVHVSRRTFSCDRLPPYGDGEDLQPFIRIWVIGRREPVIPSTIDVTAGKSRSNRPHPYEDASVWYCGSDPCIPAVDGYVAFNGAGDEGWTISFQVEFEDGRRESGSFVLNDDLYRCETRYLCG